MKHKNIELIILCYLWLKHKMRPHNTQSQLVSINRNLPTYTVNGNELE